MGQKNKNWSLILLAPFMILFINFIYGNSNYRVGSLRSSNLIKEQIEGLSNSGKKIILCAEDFAEHHIIYNEFKEYPNLAFFPFSKYDSLNLNSNIYSLVNTERTAIPNFIIENPKKWETIFDNKHLIIYMKKEE